MVSYPKKRKKIAPSHPGEILLSLYLQEMGITQTECARLLVKACRGKVSMSTMQTKLSEIIHKKRAMSPEFAVLISRVLKTEPRMWLNLQANYDIWHVEQELAFAAQA